MAALYCTGFESGFLGTGAPATSPYLPLWTLLTAAYDTTNQRTGSRCLQVDAVNGLRAQRTFAGHRLAIGRFYIKWTTLPTSGSDILIAQITTAGTDPAFYWDASSGQIGYGWLASSQTTGPVIVANTWYRVDYKIDTSAATRTMDVSVNGQAGTQATNAGSAGDMTVFQFGSATTQASGGVAVWDDMLITNVSGDYPIGDGYVRTLVPESDGTNVNASRFQDASSVAISGGNPAYQYIDELPFPATGDTTDYVKQVTADGAGEDSYCEVNFQNPTESQNAQGVMASLAYRAATATADNGACVIRDNSGTETGVYGTSASLADYSESSVFATSSIVTAPGGGWTNSELSALVGRLGYSTDVTPNPWWMALMLEVAYPSAAVPRYPSVNYTSTAIL